MSDPGSGRERLDPGIGLQGSVSRITRDLARRLLLAACLGTLLAAGSWGAGGPGQAAAPPTTSTSTAPAKAEPPAEPQVEPRPAPPEIEAPPVAPPPRRVDVPPPAPRSEMERLFDALRDMRQRMGRASETTFYVGRRHVKMLHYGTFLYEDAEKWVQVYRAAVQKLCAMPVSHYLDRPQRILELQDAVEWGRLHAIGEPFYFKKGYRRVKLVLP